MTTLASMKFQFKNTPRQSPGIFHQSWRTVLSFNLEIGDEIGLQYLHLWSHGKVQMRNHFLWSKNSCVIWIYGCWCQREEFHIKESHDTATKVYGFIIYKICLKYLYKNKAVTLFVCISMYKCCHFLLFSPWGLLHDCSIGKFIILIMFYVLALSVDLRTSKNQSYTLYLNL